MSDAPWPAPDDAEILTRITATDADQLTATATTFERAADQCEHLTGQMRGIRAAVPDSWTHGGVEAFLKYSSQLVYNLSESTNAVRTMAQHLRAHAAATEEAKNSVRAAGGLSAAASNPPVDEVSRLHHDAVERFHTSEQQVRQAFWKLGEYAPGRIPLPQAMPLPKQPGWLEFFAPTMIGNQFWLDKDLKQRPAPDAYDESHKLYGYDEDGNLVPAFMADPMRQDFKERAAIPIRGILKFLPIGSRSFETVDEAAGVLKAEVAASFGFRASHIDRHIREFFYRGTKPFSKLPATRQLLPVTAAQREEFLDVVGNALAKSNRVFKWDTFGSRTRAVLHYDQLHNRWIAVQFYDNGDMDGEFATAFIPTISQRDAMLRAETIVR